MNKRRMAYLTSPNNNAMLFNQGYKLATTFHSSSCWSYSLQTITTSFAFNAQYSLSAEPQRYFFSCIHVVFKSIHFSMILCRLSHLWSIFNLVKNTLTDPSKLSNLGLHDIQRIYPINFFRFSVIKCDLNFRNSSNFSWFSAITWNNTIALHFEMLCMQH